jgi:uncharacterized protein (DUF433 family)
MHMNTFQNGQERRSIRVREFLEDFHAGVMDEDLLAKYRLTPAGLEKFYSMLQERGILSPDEIASRYAEQDDAVEEDRAVAETSSYICPSCLTSHKTMFDICPNCGVSFQDLITAEGHSRQPDWTTASEDLLGAEEVSQAELFSTDERDLPANEIPEHPLVEEEFSEHFAEGNRTEIRGEPADAGFSDIGEDEFGGSLAEGDFPRDRANVAAAQFEDDVLHDVNGAVPYPDDYTESPAGAPWLPAARCDGCKGHLQPALRDIYDHRRSRLALVLSAILLVLVFFGSASLSFFDGYSLGRLVVVYITGMFLLFGAILGTVGAFMYLAREKVYYCASCERIYPRG